MAGLVPSIHALLWCQGVDARDKASVATPFFGRLCAGMTLEIDARAESASQRAGVQIQKMRRLHSRSRRKEACRESNQDQFDSDGMT